MLMSAGFRKFALTTHVTTSVGWLGSVAVFLALAIAGLASRDAEVVRAAYVSMHLTTWFVIVPFCVASFATGLIEGLGTPWGLFRHYWVVVKLLLTAFATFLLLLHTRPVDQIASIAMQTALASTDVRPLRLQLIGDASAALFVMLVTTTLSVYKPWGMTPYGVRLQTRGSGEGRWPRVARRRPTGAWVVAAIIGFVLLIVVLHLVGTVPHAH
jgi:hypothetical protein